jgi:hypothetical protein
LRKGRLLLASTLPRFQATHMLGPRSTERREALYAQADGVALVGLAVHPPAQVDSTSGAHDPGVGSAATKSDRVNWSGLRDLDSTVAPGRSTHRLELGAARIPRGYYGKGGCGKAACSELCGDLYRNISLRTICPS